MTDEELLDELLVREGGFVNDPADRGGPTNMGITQTTLGLWRKRPVTVEEVRQLTRGEALEIYRERYVQRPGFSGIWNHELRWLLIDCGVNHGPATAVSWLQRSLGGVAVDGVLGPETRAALAEANPVKLYVKICASRVRHYGALISRDPRQARFAHGWANRVADFIEATPFGGVPPLKGGKP